MMLGVLLARAGVRVAVLEKHADFLRDFRGDTVHPSTLELMAELGWLWEFLSRPHEQVEALSARAFGQWLPLADFTHLPTACQFLALMPQWDLLNFLVGQGRRYPGFQLLMQTTAESLIEEGGRVVGVRARTAASPASPAGPLEIRAGLTIGADGRHSTVRRAAGFAVRNLGAPMDVLWMRLARRAGDPEQALGYAAAGHILILLDRGEYWQCGLVIAKGGFEALQARGLSAFHAVIDVLVPEMRGRAAEIASWDQVKLLTVTVDRLEQWHRPGVLCIGDAAHAMSPVGGVGINLAIQDAVATANLLWEPLAQGAVQEADLARVQARRMFPVKVTQAVQVAIQNRVVQTVLRRSGDGGERHQVPLALRALQRWPYLRRFPARAVGMGARPEHIHSPDAGLARRSATP